MFVILMTKKIVVRLVKEKMDHKLHEHKDLYFIITENRFGYIPISSSTIHFTKMNLPRKAWMFVMTTMLPW